jgi:dihydroxyacetone kinase
LQIICYVSGHGPLFSVADGQMEVGLGVHGEAGVGRVPLASAREAVARLLDHMTNPGRDSHFIEAGRPR